MPRKVIPRKISLDALRVFESAARNLSFTKAAAELSMTQGAVSQRIKTLESNLGATLFRRLTRALELSREGQRLYDGLHAGFGRIEAALAGFRSTGRSRALTLTVSSSLATRWLLPRLSALARLEPPVAVALIAGDQLLDIGVDAEAALRFGRGRYPGLKSLCVGNDEVFPVCSPSFLAVHPAARDFGTPARRKAWSTLTRIVDSVAEVDRSGCGWGNWGEAVGIRWDDGNPTVAFSHAHLALQAAAEGVGIALARRVLAADDLASGRLQRLGPAVQARFAYYFVTTRGEPEARGRSLASWFKTQLAATGGCNSESSAGAPVDLMR
jgi:LysR family transcriptional regulator, glycine cleavage system transcriptional activator